MRTPIALSVTVKGPLYSKRIGPLVKKALVEKALGSIDKRLSRPPPKRLVGMQRNPVKTRMDEGLGGDPVLHFEHVEAEFHSPRRTGSSWQKKNVGIIKSVARGAIRSAADQIVSELS